MFDTVTPIMIELLYLVYLYFEKMSICKPFSSRPANSERYVVAKGFLGSAQELISFLENVVKEFASIQPTTSVPVS